MPGLSVSCRKRKPKAAVAGDHFGVLVRPARFVNATVTHGAVVEIKDKLLCAAGGYRRGAGVNDRVEKRTIGSIARGAFRFQLLKSC